MIDRPLIRKEILTKFREYLVQNSMKNEINSFFMDAGIYQSSVSVNLTGERRVLIEQHYGSLDLSKHDDLQKLLMFFGFVLKKAEQTNSSDFAALSAGLKHEGWEWKDDSFSSSKGLTFIESLKQVAIELNSQHLHEQIRRIEGSIEIDPSLAIGSAKELVETVCKSIYQRRTGKEAKDADFPQLVKSTLKELSLVPDSIRDASKGADSIKRTLSNLAQIVSGIAELRNLYGTGHGRDIREKGVKPRHAKLVVGAAVTLVTFIFETDQEQRGGLLVENCPHCEGHGSGGVMNNPCRYCNGAKKVSALLAGKYATAGAPYSTCPSCNGSSTINDHGKECSLCEASGLVANNVIA